MTTLAIQRRLHALGYDVGPLDGVRGRMTVAAIKAFQKRCGLAADGLAGPKTQAKLFGAGVDGPGGAVNVVGSEAEQQMRPWYEEALRLKGLREGTGAANNPAILDWADVLDLAYDKDSIPWCGLFVAHCIAASLSEEPLPTNPLAARAWVNFGIAAEPGLGAVLVFWRGQKSGWQGHVGFYAGEDGSAFHVLGGNQADSVSIARVAKSRLLGARWPKTAPRLAAMRLAGDAGAALSTNEA